MPFLAAMVPPVGLEPTHLAPEASALSAELRGHAPNIAVGAPYNKKENARDSSETLNNRQISVQENA